MSRPDADAGSDSAADARSAADVVLKVEGMRKEFDGVVALDGADLAVREREIVGVVGPNGAGKTTLFDCVMGSLAPTAGRVVLDGEEITGLATPKVVKRGLSRTFQIPRVFPELTVRENMVANQDHSDEGLFATAYRSTDDATAGRIDDLLAFVGLDGQAGDRAGDLSTGQQKLLNLAATLLSDPDVVLLDEPTAGVNPGLVEKITDLLLELNDDGWTFLVIEHDMDVIHEVTDYVYVLASGTNLTDGRPGEALSDPRVLEAYFGE
jgi:ABC-type branched-subunit amino acid transport system ATPase component